MMLKNLDAVCKRFYMCKILKKASSAPVLSFWHCAASKLVLSVFLIDLKLQGDADGWTSQPGGNLTHCRPQRGGEMIRAVTGWWTKIVGLQVLPAFITAAVVAKESKSGETVGTRTNRRTKSGIFLHRSEHLTEGDVLITGIRYHQGSSASISKATVNYINCLLSGPWHTATELAPNTRIPVVIQVGTRLCPAWSSWYSLLS